jgi:hypothetical protein
MPVIATTACDWMFTLTVFGPPFIARPEIASVPVHNAVIVTEAVAAAAIMGTLNTCVFVPPAATAIAAGFAVKVKPVYAPSSIVASTVADVPPVLLKVIVSVKVWPATYGPGAATGVKTILVIAMTACDWMFTLTVFGPPFIARAEVVSIPVHIAVIVTAAVAAPARMGMLNTCVFVPPAATTTAAGFADKSKPVYAPSSIVASTVAFVPPVLLKVIVSVTVWPAT